MATIRGCSSITDNNVNESSRQDKINFCIFLRCNTLSIPMPDGGGSCRTGRESEGMRKREREREREREDGRERGREREGERGREREKERVVQVRDGFD